MWLILCTSVGKDIDSFVGFICCIWLHSRGPLGMSSPDLSHTQFCPEASVRVTTDLVAGYCNVIIIMGACERERHNRCCSCSCRLAEVIGSIWTSCNPRCESAGKRRYDRKQSGYGGQTKPVFHKKVQAGRGLPRSS